MSTRASVLEMVIAVPNIFTQQFHCFSMGFCKTKHICLHEKQFGPGSIQQTPLSPRLGQKKLNNDRRQRRQKHKVGTAVFSWRGFEKRIHAVGHALGLPFFSDEPSSWTQRTLGRFFSGLTIKKKTRGKCPFSVRTEGRRLHGLLTTLWQAPPKHLARQDKKNVQTEVPS